MTARAILRLARFHAAGAVWIVPVVGALGQSGAAVGPMLLLQLLLVSVSTYVLGVVMNEIVDVEYDRRSAFVSSKPLVSGEVSVTTAKWLCFLVFLISTVSVLVFWGLLPLFFYMLTVGVGAMYNLAGKKLYGADAFMALWASLFCIFGAVVASPSKGLSVEPLVYVLAAMWFFRLMFSNSVSGGIKDLESDIAGGAKTIPLALGVHLEGGRISYTGIWWLYEIGLEMGFALSILLPLYLGMLAYEPMQTLLILIFVGIMAVTLPFISPNTMESASRDRIKKFTYLREALGFGIMGLMLLDRAGWERAILILIVPLLWFAVWVRVIYGSRLPTI